MGNVLVNNLFLGNVFFEALDYLFDGSNREKRLTQLHLKLKHYIKMFRPPSYLQKLTMEMIFKQGKSPKLKAKGAETRHMVLFGLQLAQELNEKLQSSHSKTVLQAMSHMMDFYQEMASANFDPDMARLSCQSFLLLYSALSDEAEANASVAWKLKPKMHLFQELAEYSVYEVGNPSEFWSYKDEDFMGWVAAMAYRRGGKVEVCTTTLQVLNRYRAWLSDPSLKDA